MNRFSWPTMLAAAIVAAWATDARAQQTQTSQDPHIQYVYPAGGQAGATFEVAVGGEFLQGVCEAHVSGGGVRITIGPFFQHLTRDQASRFNNDRRRAVDRLKAREKTRGGSADREFSMEEIEKEVAFTEYEKAQEADSKKRAADKKRQLNPQLMEEVKLKITIDAKTPAGVRELRVLTHEGMSNPLFFHVGRFPEVCETEPNDTQPDAAVGDRLPVTINGQILPGDVDRFSFKARKGMHLVAVASARDLIPYLADAVPGWLQAVLTLYDPDGTDVAVASSAFGFRQDPVLFYEVPRDGEYVIEIRDSLYRGREDFVYRIVLGELPYITGIFPLGGKAHSPLEVQLRGWNLPVDKLSVDPVIDRGRSIRQLSVAAPDGTLSNSVPFAVDTMPEIMESEPNNRREEAQTVAIPCSVNGRIDKPGDVDVFCFEGHPHEKIVAEIYGRRLGSPIDSFLRLMDESGREIAFNDDFEDKSLALSTHHADSRMVVDLPAAGKYYLFVSDARRNGGPEYVYRLQMRFPRPDFDLRVGPSSLSGLPGATLPITVYAIRKDGHAEDIFLDLEKALPGYKLSGAWLPGNLDKIRMTLTIPNEPTPEPISLEMIGHSLSRGSSVTHLAVPADTMMQAFAYQHVVPAKDWTVMVTARSSATTGRPSLQYVRDEKSKGRTSGSGKLAAREERLKLMPGNTFKLHFAAGSQAKDIHLELSEPPAGFSVKSVTPEGEFVAMLVQTDSAKVKPGQKGNLLVNAFWDHLVEEKYGGKKGPGKKDDDKKPQQVRTPLGMMPALPFEVLAVK